MKFKLGDKVRCIINHNKECIHGKVAIVSELHPPDSVYLRYENGDGIGLRGVNELEKVQQ